MKALLEAMLLNKHQLLYDIYYNQKGIVLIITSNKKMNKIISFFLLQVKHIIEITSSKTIKN